MSPPDIGPTYVDSILSLWVMWWVELCSIFIQRCHHPCMLCKCICTCRWTNHWKLWPCSGQAACVYHNVLPINTCTWGLPDCWAEPGNEARCIVQKFYRWLSGGMALLPEGKGRCLGLVQLCAKYGEVSATYLDGTPESLPLVPKDKRSCFSQGERSTVQLPLDHAFALRKWNA